MLQYLEPKVFAYRNHFEFFYMLGYACLMTNDLGGAESYFKRCIELEPSSISSRLCTAALYLRRNEVSRCLRIWLEILDQDSKNRWAKRGLKLLKQSAEYENTKEYFQKINLGALVPPSGRVWPFRLFLGLCIGTALIGLGVFNYHWIQTWKQKQNTERTEIKSLSLSDVRGDYVDLKGKYLFVFTTKDIRFVLAKAIAHLRKYEDNLAQYELNRILYSNAVPSIKEKALYVSSLLHPKDEREKINFITLKNNFHIREVLKTPFLYENCWVKWSGKIANLSKIKDRTQFDFLVGYETNKEIHGILSVETNETWELYNNEAVEVLGKIFVAENKPVLKLFSIRHILP